MPVPEPEDGEDPDEFIGRCISTLEGKDPEKSNDQITAICYRKAREAGMDVSENREESTSVTEQLRGGTDVEDLVEERINEQDGRFELDELLRILSESVEDALDLETGDPENGFRNTGRIPGRAKLVDEGEGSVSVRVGKLKDDVEPEEIGTAIHEPVPGEGEITFKVTREGDGRLRFVAEKGVTEVLGSSMIPNPTEEKLRRGIRDSVERWVETDGFRVGFFGVV